jgi:hypothetical protein
LPVWFSKGNDVYHCRGRRHDFRNRLESGQHACPVGR